MVDVGRGLIIVNTAPGKGKTTALSCGMLDPAKVVEGLKKKPEMVHVILTGRNAHPTIVELADTVTEMGQVKHAYQKGVIAAIEY